MKPASFLTIRISTPQDATDAMAAHLALLINHVYRETDAGILNEETNRTSSPEIKEMLEKSELLLAELDGKIVGSARVSKADFETAKLSMLMCHPEYRNQGIGTALIAKAEDWAREQHCVNIFLELLIPREWIHPHKEFLAEWYTQLGYQPYNTIPCEEVYP